MSGVADKSIEWSCPCCREIVFGLPALTFTTPGNLPPLRKWQRDRLGGKADDIYVDRKTNGTFVRAVLSLPVTDSGEELQWGVWGSLSKENFNRYRRSFWSRKQSELGAMFSWFYSSCPGYPETIGLKCQLHLQDEGRRPVVVLEPTDHPLAIDQRSGITRRRALELAGPWLKQMRHAN